MASYLGLVLLEDSSGNRRRLGHITKQGSSMLRFLLVEAAQVTVRSLSEWRRQYSHLMMRRGRKTAKVAMALRGGKDRLYFTYSDDGVGMDLSAFEGSFQHMGIAGIEKRVFSLEGEVALKSAPLQGFYVTITLPVHTQQKGERYGNLIG